MVQCVGKGPMGRARGICGMRYLVCFVRIFVSIYLHIRSPILISSGQDHHATTITSTGIPCHRLSFLKPASPSDKPFSIFSVSLCNVFSLLLSLSLLLFIFLSFFASFQYRNAFVFADSQCSKPDCNFDELASFFQQVYAIKGQ